MNSPLRPLPSSSSAAFLAIDFTPKYTKDLDPAERPALLAGVRGFASAIGRGDIPTFWFSFQDDEFRAYGGMITGDAAARRKLVARYHLGDCDPQPGETIIGKNVRSALGAGRLQKHLSLFHPRVETFIVAGGNTSQCVAATVDEALRAGYRCHVVTDLLFDLRPTMFLKPDAWHKALLRSTLSEKYKGREVSAATQAEWFGRLSFSRSDEALQIFSKKPAPQATPV